MPHRAGQGHHEDYSGGFQVLASAEKAQRGPEASKSPSLAGNSTSWSEKVAEVDRVTSQSRAWNKSMCFLHWPCRDDLIAHFSDWKTEARSCGAG